jgi:hypothetical protein
MNANMSHMNDLLKKIRAIKVATIEPEVQQKIGQAHALLGEIYQQASKRMKKVVSNSSLLSRDHVFFDGDHQNHSGAV